MIKPEYKYRAIYRSNYDGDTIRFDFDMGKGIWDKGDNGKGDPVRLHGIDTAELRDKDPENKELAYAARDFVEAVLTNATDIVVETIKDRTGKYGRYLATVWYFDENGGGDEGEDEDGWINLNRLLVLKDLAVEKEY